MNASAADPTLCPVCAAEVLPSARFCRACGSPLEPQPAPTAPDMLSDEVMLPAPPRLRVAGDRISLRALQQMVNQGVNWWQMRLSAGEATRAEAATSIEELRAALGSVSEQLAAGHETIRITSRLPSQRRFPQGCSRCGRGNRLHARFCIACGRPFAQPVENTMPDPHLRFRAAVESHPGQRRANNQDSALIQTYVLGDGRPILVGIVADGMGGAKGGEHASAMAVASIDAHLQHFCQSVGADYTGWADVVRAAIAAANSAVFREAERKPQYRGMGTTVVLALLVDDRAFIGNAGDSRAYLINPEGVSDQSSPIVQLTTDHTMVARLVDIGQITPEQALTHPRRHVLYRSVGVEPTIDPEVDEQPLQEGDWLLLCSDGIINELEDSRLSELVLAHASTRAAALALIAAANDHGARDNVTALVIRTLVETKPDSAASQ